MWTNWIHILAMGRCGHCKKLAPEYEKLGASFKKAKSVLIGKVSSSEYVMSFQFFIVLESYIMELFLWLRP